MSLGRWSVYRYVVADAGLRCHLDRHAQVLAVVLGRHAYCVRWKKGKTV